MTSIDFETVVFRRMSKDEICNFAEDIPVKPTKEDLERGSKKSWD